MARIEAIEQRLREWAQWVTAGDGSGYPSKCTLHPEWSPPAAGTTPTLKAAAPSRARQTHRAIARLSVRLSNTVVVVYCMNLSEADRAERLSCQPATVRARLYALHRQLALLLDESVSK